jgi:D-alanine-D-alanine ligase
MSHKKIRVGILFGGKSAEHEVSLQSAKNVVDALDTDKYEVTLIGIDKNGKWLLPNKSQFLLNESDPKLIRLNKDGGNGIALIPQSVGELTNLTYHSSQETVDVIFPILHGPFGEDGTVQGLLKLSGVPFVGAGVLGSAIGMDKDVMKRLLRDADIPIGKFLVFQDKHEIDFDKIVTELGLPFFVKPANMGSSVGVSKVINKENFEIAINTAFEYDNKILVEEFIDGRELECAVLGNQDPQASEVGEVESTQEFYSYEAKYIDIEGAVLTIPATIPDDVRERIRDLSIKTFKILSCEGLGRIDFFLKKDGTILVNEINTIPGFTKISMYPQLWMASGVTYPELINRLIELAIERSLREQRLKCTY